MHFRNVFDAEIKPWSHNLHAYCLFYIEVTGYTLWLLLLLTDTGKWSVKGEYSMNQHIYLYISMKIAVFGSTLPCHLSDGTICPPLLCPNTSIILTCTLSPMATRLGYTIWKLPNGTCGSRSFSGLPQDTITLYQDGLTNCANTMPDTCGGYRGQIGFACRNSTLSVTVTPETNGSDVKCYNANYSAFELVGSANIQLMPASKPSFEGGGGGVCKQSKVILSSILCITA